MSDKTLRSAWGTYYLLTLHAPPPAEWESSDGEGTISIITREFGISAGSRESVRGAISDAWDCLQRNEEYVGERPSGRGGNNVLISIGSQEETIVAVSMEAGRSLKVTTDMVNRYRQGERLEHVGVSAVHSCYLRLKPVVTSISKMKQGSKDPNSKWAMARHGWCLQLLIRFREIGADALLAALASQRSSPYGAIKDAAAIKVLPRPAYFSEEHLGAALSICQIAWWDETHMKVAVAGKGHKAAGSKFQVRFPRDEKGRLDPNGKQLGERQYDLNIKYSEESRLSLGVAQIELPDGSRVGRRCQAYDYTSLWICTISEWEKRCEAEFTRVGELQGGGGNYWIETGRNENDLFLLDSVMQMKGGRGAILVEAGLPTVNDVADWLKRGAPRIKGIGKATVNILRALVAAAKDEPLPVAVDHSKAANPYESKFGEEEWEGVVEQKLGYSCVTRLIEHIMMASATVFAGTAYEDSWLFYHDALSQMTNKETVEWMKTKDYYKRWLTPANGLNAGTVYANRPTGDSPELMCMDASLNKDVDDVVARGVVATSHLPDDDVRKMVLSTPKRQTAAYLKVWDPTFIGENEGAASSVRIVQDTNKFFTSCRAIVNASGAVVHGLASRGGHRADALRDDVERRGGVRVKGSAPERIWLPPDIQGVEDEWLREVVKKK